MVSKRWSVLSSGNVTGNRISRISNRSLTVLRNSMRFMRLTKTLSDPLVSSPASAAMSLSANCSRSSRDGCGASAGGITPLET